MNNATTHFLRMYTKGDRTYHGVGHILDLFELYNGKAIRGLEGYEHNWKALEAVDIGQDALELAILAHDCVYNGARTDNEELSNEAFISYATDAGYNSDYITYTSELIMCTKKHNVLLSEVGSEEDQAVMISLDLAGLASGLEVFDNNTLLIRKEFSHVSDEDWKKGRAAWFESMLKKHEETGIYPHPWAYQHWEMRAVDNIKRGRDKLLNV